MPLVNYIFLASVFTTAAVPALACAQMPSLAGKHILVRLFVFTGTMIMFLPLALIAMLVVFLQVFGIDMID